MSSSKRTNCGSKHCASCGDSLNTNTPTLLPLAYETPQESFPKLIPLRWRFSTTKDSCVACKEKHLEPQAWDEAQVHGQQIERSEQAIKLEHLERHDKELQQRQSKRKQHQAQVELEKREKLQERRLERKSSREHVFGSRRKRGSSRTSNVQHDFIKLLESSSSKWSEHTMEVKTLTNQCTNFEKVPRQRIATNGQCKVRLSDKRDDVFSATAEVCGKERSPSTHLDKSSSSMTFFDSKDSRQLRVESQQMDESDEERRHVRSASYAHLLLRMRQHYDNVQVTGARGYRATAPPRRIRHERCRQSVVDRDHEEEPTKADPTDVAIDLAYLRVYKDAR